MPDLPSVPCVKTLLKFECAAISSISRLSGYMEMRYESEDFTIEFTDQRRC